MIRHLLKLVWNRKRSTALLMAEIAASFLVVFGVVAFALHALANWNRPLGYDWRDVWALDIDMNVTTDDDWTPEQVQTFRDLLAAARELPRVQAAAGIFSMPYDFSTSNGSVEYQKRSTYALVNEVTDDLQQVLGLRLVAGRWFGREDDGAAIPPVVINRQLARFLFEEEEPIGKVFDRGGDEVRVVGVIDEFRQHGELASPEPYVFRRVRVDGSTGEDADRPPRQLVLRMAPGTPASYELAVLERLGRVAPEWSLEVQPLASLRDRRLRLGMTPLVIGATVGAFLLLMVALGLLGVLWQNVTRRTRELGLRRAVGASLQAIRRQVLLELLLVASLAVLPALVLVLQLPLLEVIESLTTGVFAAAVVGALVLIYGLCIVCGLYPARIATRLEPAEALRWE